jgi:hypothetical protein
MFESPCPQGALRARGTRPTTRKAVFSSERGRPPAAPALPPSQALFGLRVPSLRSERRVPPILSYWDESSP